LVLGKQPSWSTSIHERRSSSAERSSAGWGSASSSVFGGRPIARRDVNVLRQRRRRARCERTTRRLVELEVICRPAEKGDTIHAQEIAMKKEGNKVGARWVRLHRPFRPLRWCARHVPPGHETTRQSQVNSRVPEISLSSHFHPSSIHPPATRIHSLPQSSSPRPTTLAGSLYAPCSFYRPTRSFSLHARSSFRVGRARDARFALLTFSQCPSGPGFS
jgi:hypothetical protein